MTRFFKLNLWSDMILTSSCSPIRKLFFQKVLYAFVISSNIWPFLFSWTWNSELDTPADWKWYFVTKLVLTYCEKNCSSDGEKHLKFEAEGREFAKIFRSLEQFIKTVKGQNIFWQQNAFFTCSRFLEVSQI